MPFFYDKDSELPGPLQYRAYLEASPDIGDLKVHTNKLLDYHVLEIKRAVRRGFSHADTSDKQTIKFPNIFGPLISSVCGSPVDIFGKIITGLADIKWNLRNINEKLSDLYSMLDWKTDILIEEQKISNFYLGKITDLLKIPDSQKQRSYHIELGISYLKNAIAEGPGSDFYSDALEEFTKAEQIEAKDYFCLNKMGLIYLYSIKALDVIKAHDYFIKSARYAKAIANVIPSEAEGPSRHAIDRIDNPLTKEVLLNEAAYSLNYASRCNYILAKFQDAIDLSKQTLELEPNNLEFKMHLAKCLAADGQEEEATNTVLKIIESDKLYAVKVLADFDFLGRPFISDKIEASFTEFVQKTTSEINEIRAVITPQMIAAPTKAIQKFSTIQNAFKEQTYFNARIVYPDLIRKEGWHYKHYIFPSHYMGHIIEKERYYSGATLSEMIRFEVGEQKKRSEFLEWQAAEIQRIKDLPANKRILLRVITSFKMLIIIGTYIALWAIIIVVAVGVWLWGSFKGSSIYFLLLHWIIDGAIIGTAIYALLRFLNEWSSIISILILLIGSCAGIWLFCQSLSEDRFFGFLITLSVVAFVSYRVVRIVDHLWARWR